ncbi:5-oxoprolinase subunit PxpB [Colwelliaceae bacterium MEBiC 14330]
MSVIISDAIRLEVAGENALILYFFEPKLRQGNVVGSISDARDNKVISTKLNKQVQQAAQLIRFHLADDIVDLIPSYASILVVFDLIKIDHHQLRNKLQVLLQDTDTQAINQGKVIKLPVYYSLESGRDLPRVAKRAQLSIEQVIEIHQAQTYSVYAIGFAPGFAYLGEVEQRIATPRLSSPRLKVPKGAVAIADRQTAVYPADSPGGWNIIGLCPLAMFDANLSPPMPISVGDSVKFVAIDKQQYLELGGKICN